MAKGQDDQECAARAWDGQQEKQVRPSTKVLERNTKAQGGAKEGWREGLGETEVRAVSNIIHWCRCMLRE